MAGSIKNMHYDYKQKLNRLDSNKYIGLQIPQIDRKLNEALNLYILLVAEPRIKNQLGIETTQRTIDDINIMVKDDISLSMASHPDGYVIAILPSDYLYYLSTEHCLGIVDNCIEQEMMTFVIKHDSRSNQREFYKSNFDWRECNIRFYDQGIKIFADNFIVSKFSINYIKVHPYIHNAEDFNAGTYNLPDGTALTGYQDCILPEITHAEIVDLAVLLTTGELELPTAYQFKQNKLSMTQLITN